MNKISLVFFGLIIIYIAPLLAINNVVTSTAMDSLLNKIIGVEVIAHLKDGRIIKGKVSKTEECIQITNKTYGGLTGKKLIKIDCININEIALLEIPQSKNIDVFKYGVGAMAIIIVIVLFGRIL